MINWVIQNIASKLYLQIQWNDGLFIALIKEKPIKKYHRVTLIVAFFTYLADVLFSIFNSPELSIQMAKYNQNPTTMTNAMKV